MRNVIAGILLFGLGVKLILQPSSVGSAVLGFLLVGGSVIYLYVLYVKRGLNGRTNDA